MDGIRLAIDTMVLSNSTVVRRDVNVDVDVDVVVDMDVDMDGLGTGMGTGMRPWSISYNHKNCR